jgi:hypothetical protein
MNTMNTMSNQKKKVERSNNVSIKMILFYIKLATLFFTISCQEHVSADDIKNLNTNLVVDLEKTNEIRIDTLIYEELITRVQGDDYSYFSDTIYGECLIYHLGFYTEDENGNINSPVYLSRIQIMKKINKYETFLSLETQLGTIKEALIKKMKLFDFILWDEKTITFSISLMEDEEFESSCLFHFKQISGEYLLIGIQGVG